MLPWAEWVAQCRLKRNRGQWEQLFPNGGDLEGYDFCGDDAEAMAQLGALVAVLRAPPIGAEDLEP